MQEAAGLPVVGSAEAELRAQRDVGRVAWWQRGRLPGDFDGVRLHGGRR